MQEERTGHADVVTEVEMGMMMKCCHIWRNRWFVPSTREGQAELGAESNL